MSVVIEGEAIMPDDMQDLERRLMSVSSLSLAEREEAITVTLEQSARMLSLVSQATDPARFASAGRAAAEMAAHYAKRLDVSKDMVLDAQVQQRRWERALGVAIREGQARGEIETPDEAKSRAGQSRHHVHQMNALKDRPLDYAKRHELSGVRGGDGIYAMTDGATDADFMEALSDARNEGNVSRANVVRKVREVRGVAPAAEPTRKGDKRRAAKQVKVLRNITFELRTFAQILNDLTDAGLDPAITDEEARDIIASLDGFTRATGRIKKSLT